ncbi:MAG: pyridoxamine 5'-phosphate oxidase family protein [Amphritea sp.]|nr:pyridoxamine 5'-phosphate oxidase family protein [Amphritea sp.]
MGDRFEMLEQKHIEFIQQQKMYFIGTAATEGFVNVSPKGIDSFRVLGKNRVAWLNLTGSGNESAAHVLDNDRMTVMFCSFEKQPLILRLYGRAQVFHERDSQWTELLTLFPDYVSARQVFVVDIDLVQSSCGFAVPYYEYKEQRPTLLRWADNKGRDGVLEYQRERNRLSLNGFDTGIEDDQAD